MNRIPILIVQLSCQSLEQIASPELEYFHVFIDDMFLSVHHSTM
jgi:hypothetical protein